MIYPLLLCMLENIPGQEQRPEMLLVLQRLTVLTDINYKSLTDGLVTQAMVTVIGHSMQVLMADSEQFLFKLIQTLSRHFLRKTIMILFSKSPAYRVAK